MPVHPCDFVWLCMCLCAEPKGSEDWAAALYSDWTDTNVSGICHAFTLPPTHSSVCVHGRVCVCVRTFDDVWNQWNHAIMFCMLCYSTFVMIQMKWNIFKAQYAVSAVRELSVKTVTKDDIISSMESWDWFTAPPHHTPTQWKCSSNGPFSKWTGKIDLRRQISTPTSTVLWQQ